METTAISRIGREGRRHGDGAGLALQQALLGKDPVPHRARRDGLPPVRRAAGGRPARGLGCGRVRGPGVLAAGHGHGPRRQARAGRLRDDGDRRRDPGRREGLPDLAQGARRRLPDEPAPPLDALLAAARRAARALRDGAGDRRLLLRAGVRPHRLADPDGIVRRRDVDALRDRLLRRQGLPLPVRPALPRARRGLVRQGLLLRPDLPRGEVQDPPPPDRVLDGRARGRLPRFRGALRARRGLHRVPRRARARALRRGAEAPRARPDEARDRHEALPADHLPRRDQELCRARGSR